MSHAVLSEPHHATASTFSSGRTFVWVVLAVWGAIVFAIAANGLFPTPPGTPPLKILAAVAVPIALFVGAYFASPTVRDLVLTADLRLITSLHALRFVGFGFLGFYAVGLLPAHFAWPAALGDMAIAVTAPWLARAVRERTNVVASKTFVVWNLFGILDFVVAVTMAGAAPLLFPSLRTGVGNELLAQLPLVLIPTYVVPMFTIFHLIALIQARHRR